MALGELKNGIGPDAYAIYQQVLAAVVERDHPVGSLYISENPTSPAELYGGTWERIEGKFIMGASDTYPAGSTGGEAEHILTISEAPGHTHEVGAYGNPGWRFKIDGNVGVVVTSGSYVLINNVSLNLKDITDNGFLGTSYVGGNEPHNNLPPYIAMYIWRRVA